MTVVILVPNFSQCDQLLGMKSPYGAKRSYNVETGL